MKTMNRFGGKVYMDMKILTQPELNIMNVLWSSEGLFLSDIVKQLPEPRSAYATISTVVRTLVDKGYITYNVYGRCNQYTAAVSKNEYRLYYASLIKKNLFEDSEYKMISFILKYRDENK